MSININFPFDTQSDYTLDAGLEITGGKVQSKLMDNPGQEFEQDFASSSGFTFDPTKAEFVGGKVQQKDQRPANATFGATYTADINGNWGGGVLTGTAIGGAGVSGGKLDLAYNDLRRVDYAALGNADAQQVGCIRFKITPNYTGSPGSERWFFAISKASGDWKNAIALRHTTSGPYLRLHMYDSAGVLIVEHLCGVWSPTAGQEYEFELNWDLATGATRFFINGVQSGTTFTGTGTRDSNIGLLRIGNGVVPGLLSNFKIDDLIVFDQVQHTSNYTLGDTIPENIYATNVVQLPQFSYSGIGEIQSFDDFTATETNSPRWILNGQYWNGTAWMASSSTWGTASPAATVLANIATLPASDTLDISAVFNDGAVLMDVDNLIVEYTGQIYSITEQKIYPNTIFRTDQLEAYLMTASNNVRIIFKKSSINYYWTGAAWAVSDGTWAQSNTAAQLVTVVLNAFPGGTADVKPVWLLKSDGTIQEYITDVIISYSFAGPVPTLETCTIWDYHYNLDGTPKEGILISANLLDTAELPTQGATLGVLKQEVYTGSDGYWEIAVAYDPTDERPQYIRFLINGIESKKIMQFQASLKFSEMVDVGNDI